jgi:endogenous inhibitor of DNA gyrase (YacG/DUF329 family)
MLTVRCPSCKKTSLWSEANASRPFCSPRCKDIDLGAWASDAYVVEGAAPSTAEEMDVLEQALVQTTQQQQ